MMQTVDPACLQAFERLQRHLDVDRYEPVTAARRSVKRSGRRPNRGLRVLRPTGTG